MIVASDLYEVPCAKDLSGAQKRPTEVTIRDGYTCPICDFGVMRLTSASGNPFFRHLPGGPTTCRSEPKIHWAARDILRSVFERVRAQQVVLHVRVPCASCGAGNEISFSIGDTTEVAADVLLEPAIAVIDGADLCLRDNGVPLAGVVIITASARPALLRSELPIHWIAVNALTVKGSNTLRKAVYGQQQEVTLSAIGSSTVVTCMVCKAQQERIRHEEVERQQQVVRDQVRLEQHVHALAARLSQLDSWWIVVPNKCTICHNDLAVSVNRSFFDHAEALVRDDEGRAWHVGLMRGGKVVLGILIVQAATFDGEAQLGGTVSYAVVPLLDEPFAPRDGEQTLIAKYVRFMKEPKLQCIHCAQVERLTAEAKQRAEAKRVADQEAKRRTEVQRVADQARQQQARRNAEEEQQRVEREIDAARKAARVAREIHERSPRGQLERLVETVTTLIAHHDQPTFLRTYRDLRQTISAYQNADFTAEDLATEARARLDRMARLEWVSVQRRERDRREAAEQAKQQAAVTASWEALLVQLTAWSQTKEWTIQEEMAIDAFERVLRVNGLIKAPTQWAELVAGRKRHARPPEVRAAVLLPR